MTRRRAAWPLGLLLMFAPAAASVGYRPHPGLEAELALESPPELGSAFRALGRVRFLSAARGVRLRIQPPGGVETLEGGSVERAAVSTGAELEVWARLRVRQPLLGVPLKLSVEWSDAATVASDERIETRTLYLDVTEHEGAEGLPGDSWRHYLPAARGLSAGYVLADFGHPAEGGSVAQADLRSYQQALARLDAGDPAGAEASFEPLTAGADSGASLAAKNGLAVSRSLRHDARGADRAWQSAFETLGASDRVIAYLEYNLGVSLWARGQKEAAGVRFRAALARHPGFTTARKALAATAE